MAQASAEKLEYVGLSKRKKWPQCHKESSLQGRLSSLWRKRKEQNHQSKSPDREMGKRKREREPHLGERAGDHSEKNIISET